MIEKDKLRNQGEGFGKGLGLGLGTAGGAPELSGASPLFDILPQQVWKTDEDGKLYDVNEMICRDFGEDRASIISSGWESFVHPDDLGAVENIWKASLVTGGEYRAEFRLRFADGLYYWHLARAVQYIEGGKICWLGTNTDIHAQKGMDLRKDEFISIASHELKTPLTTIKGYNQLMLRSVEESRMKNLLKRSSAQLERLEKLISDLLEVSKINAGKLSFNYERFDFLQMLSQTVAGMQEISLTHQIVLESDLSVDFHGDRFRLEQVVQNFLSNAIKYSPGADTVVVRARMEDGYIVVSIQDFGIGIARESMSRLFERYYRVDNSASRFEGLGMGLFISAEIIKRHSGSFWIESEIGQGSTFSFKLPLEPDLRVQPDVVTDTFYRDRYINIHCVKGSDIMHVEWTGHQDMNSVKNGGQLMIGYLRRSGMSKVFNDNRLVPGTWSEASDWAAEVWLPSMERAGLKYFAWIFSPSAFSQLSAMKSVDNDDKSAEIMFFNSAQEGMEWLDNR